MMNYNYLEAMTEDVKDYIKENYSDDEIMEQFADRDEWETELHDDLWTVGSVTGNASGSYTFNSYKAQEYVTDNMELLKEALQEFSVDAETITEKFLDEEWEYFDVTIRCYLLSQAISEALDELEEDYVIPNFLRGAKEQCTYLSLFRIM